MLQDWCSICTQMCNNKFASTRPPTTPWLEVAAQCGTKPLACVLREPFTKLLLVQGQIPRSNYHSSKWQRIKESAALNKRLLWTPCTFRVDLRKLSWGKSRIRNGRNRGWRTREWQLQKYTVPHLTCLVLEKSGILSSIEFLENVSNLSEVDYLYAPKI